MESRLPKCSEGGGENTLFFGGSKPCILLFSQLQPIEKAVEIIAQKHHKAGNHGKI
jgi:hypothetical protein